VVLDGKASVQRDGSYGELSMAQGGAIPLSIPAFWLALTASLTSPAQQGQRKQQIMALNSYDESVRLLFPLECRLKS